MEAPVGVMLFILNPEIAFGDFSGIKGNSLRSKGENNRTHSSNGSPDPFDKPVSSIRINEFLVFILILDYFNTLF